MDRGDSTDLYGHEPEPKEIHGNARHHHEP
jgi:hypothetical protein